MALIFMMLQLGIRYVHLISFPCPDTALLLSLLRRSTWGMQSDCGFEKEGGHWLCVPRLLLPSIHSALEMTVISKDPFAHLLISREFKIWVVRKVYAILAEWNRA